MNNIFNENMSESEAIHAFFVAIDNKPEDEIEEIKRQLFEVLPLITKRELEKGYMTEQFKIKYGHLEKCFPDLLNAYLDMDCYVKGITI